MNHQDNCTCQLNDAERLEDLLTQEKYMITAYSSLVPEADAPDLRQVLTENLDQSIQCQYEVFDNMRSRGWYPTKPALEPDVVSAREKFAQMKLQMTV